MPESRESSDPPSSDEDRPLPVRRRRDLVIERTGGPRQPVWTVKDPLALRYYQLRETDYFVFQQLDGETSIREIQDRFFRTFSPRRLAPQQVLQFIHRLWNQGLVTVDRFGLSAGLLGRMRQIDRAKRTQFLPNVLAIRFRGVDPDKLLSGLLPLFGWLFSLPALLAALMLIVSAGVLVGTEWERLSRDLPGLHAFLQAERLFWFALTIGGVKIVHELAHGLTCKKFGGECHELGLMLLAFVPCLYCNVSDAWLLKRRRHRIAISAAGIYAELVMASLCAFLWYFSVPGLVHSISLNVMIVCSVNTLLLNGNPLLRYDGYYILSDLVDVPNLRGRALSVVRSWWARVFLGLRTGEPRPDRAASDWFLGLYGITSAIYLWAVVFVILWMLYQFAERYGIEAVVVALGLVIVGTRLFASARRLFGFLRVVHHEGRLPMLRFSLSSLMCAAALAALLLIPLPRQVRAPALVTAAGPQPVFVTSPGRLEFPRDLKPGEPIRSGEILATLTNHELEQDVLKLEGQVVRQQKRIELLESRQVTDPNASSQLPSARAALKDFQERLDNRRADLKRLTLVSPVGGILLPAEQSRLPPGAESLLHREGQPFDRRNRGAWLEVGTPFCLIADPRSRDAVLYVDQSEASLLQPGQPVRLTVRQTAGRVLYGTVTEVAARPVEHVPIPLAAEQLIPTQTGSLHPARPVHEVRVRLEEESEVLAIDQLARGSITIGREALATCLLRALRQTLTFEL